MPTLTIQLPSQPPVFHVLRDETMTIGRMKGNTIVIEDSSISLMHAKITRKDGQFYLKDLNSTNGTMVNGQPIGEARLRDQDKVRFAEITAQFLMEDIVPAGAAVAAPAAVPAGTPVSLVAPRPAAAVAGVPPGPVPAPAQAKPEASTPTTASTAQTQITRKTTTTASTSAKKTKVSHRVLIVAAALVLVVLPGVGLVLWKTTGRETQKPELANAPQQTRKAAPNAAKTATAVTAPKTPVEGTPTPAATETVSSTTSNVGELVAALKSKDVAERRQAAAALHDLGMEAKEAIPALKEALKDPDSEVQMWAALALVNTQAYDKAVIPILVRSLKNDNTVLRQVACLSLGLIPYQEGDKTSVVPALTDIAGKDPSEEVRQAAKSALNIIGAEGGGAEGTGK